MIRQVCDMNRILIIGCPGSGKSTFARKLAAKTGLRLIYLDMMWHRSDRTTVSPEEFDGQLESVLNGERWIIDGNYIRTLPRRLSKCDTVFYFDLPVETCLAGAMERLGKPRVDMPWSDDVMDDEFRQWILNFNRDQAPLIEIMLTNYKRTTVVFKSRDEADRYIASL